MANSSILDLKDILGGYSKQIDDLTKEIAEEVARDGVKKIKNASPTNKKNTLHKGRYKRGWAIDIQKGFGTIEATIHNKTDYQLTHLLERKHHTRNGGWAYPESEGHISKVQDEVSKEFEDELIKRIEELG